MSRPPIPLPPYKGGCLCGSVRYRLESGPLGVHACHCNDCKKLSGATHIVMVVAGREGFVHETGEVTRYRKRADSGRDIDIVRCPSCGVRLWHEPVSSPGLAMIAAGTLDNAEWARPAAHIWIEKAPADFPFEDGALKVEGQPPDRQMLFDAFARLISF